MEIISGFVLGILGSMHCVGMCGPIALAIPHKSTNKTSIAIDNAFYNGGRVITYMILGTILGLIGSAISFSGLQEKLSIVIGVLMLVLTFGPKIFKISGKVDSFFYSGVGKLKGYFSTFLRKKGKLALFTLGLLNGLLPCGLVYVALAASLGIADYMSSMGFMAGFGIGTAPAMFAVSYLGIFASAGVRQKFTKLIPYGIAIVAILMILRGMALGIPYISPQLPTTVEQPVENCCH
ncbi:MAG: hypothetical protein CVV25_09190 [Ignavibacteriae bacterium HGW-Ignavibacteriae-4]|nr:MAG: hypothetical protein CVV25_09190 [Ignavibacteriae bacterium HGW-Ignavibacteriae-4]